MKAWLSLDDLARNCQGFGLILAVHITGAEMLGKERDVKLFHIPFILPDGFAVV